MISKELLSEVLGCKVNSCFIDNNICSYDNNGAYIDINIYELAHKCKEWASIKYKFSIESAIGYGGYYSHIKSWNDSTFKTVFFHNKYKSEPEAIFKATQYIYDKFKQS